VRTPAEVDAVVRDDLKAHLGLLDLRHVAGDAGLSGRVRSRVLDRWAASGPDRVGELVAEATARWRIAGDAAFLLEPDLKESRGALRDVGLLRALALAQLVDLPTSVREDEQRLLDIRTSLQTVTGQAGGVLRLQEQGPVALDVGLADADTVLRSVNETARGIAQTLDDAVRRTSRTTPAGGSGLTGGLRRWLGRGGPSSTDRTPLARDVVAQGGEVVLARDADPWADPVLVLRAARAAAEHDLALSPFTLERLATEAAPLPQPWSAAARGEFVRLLGQGRAAVRVVEALDAAGLWEPLLPEWAEVRYRAQHNPVHRFTVDRHLLETAAEAADLVRDVDRPDLLLVGALLHDIGKGRPGRDHSEVGAEMVAPIAERMGFPPDDVAVLTDLARYHLLLPDTATRRDLDDVVTVSGVADAVGSRGTLELLHSLSIADAAATGPAAWSPWKAGLIADLVRRTSRMLQGAPMPPVAELPEHLAELARAGKVSLTMTGDPAGDGATVDVVTPDRPGVLSLTAGVLGLHSLDVQAATIHTVGSTAVNSFHVVSRFGSVPDVTVMRGDLDRALAGALPLDDRLRTKERTYAAGADPGPSPRHREPLISWLDEAASGATVLEVRTDDAIGLLFRLTRALEGAGLDIRSARVSSLGRAVVDVFYLTAGDGSLVGAADRPELTDAVRRATAASV
jgi:[protein-PII] uridylyltransferase